MAQTKMETGTNPASRTAWLKALGRKNLGVYFALVLLVIISVILNPVFLGNPDNIMNILKNMAIFGGFAAIGLTYVIITGGIDLSIAAIMSYSSCIICMFNGLYVKEVAAGATGVMASEGMWIFLAILTIVGGSAVIALINGALVTYRRIEPFIVTLGTMTLMYGITKFMTGGNTTSEVFRPLGDFANGTFNFWKDGHFSAGFISGKEVNDIALKIPFLPLIFFIFAVVFILILRKSVYGRHVYAVGGNSEAARLSGIRVNKVVMITYILCALLAAFNGLMYGGWIRNATWNTANGLELDAIAAVVIGGTAMSGGVGGVGSTLAGLAIITIITNILNLLNVDPKMFGMFKGAIILIAVSVQTRRAKK